MDKNEELAPGVDDKSVSRRQFLKIAGIAGAAVTVGGGLAGLLAGCGEDTTTTTTAAGAGATTTSAASGGTATTAAAGATTTVFTGSSAVERLPAEQQGWYVNADVNMGPSPLESFKPKNGPPWKIGYTSNYAGNTWRTNIMIAINDILVPKYKELGLLSELVILESNLDDALEIQQIRQLVDQGCDGIFTASPPTSSLDGVIEYAFNAGIPFVTLSGIVTSPYAINTANNYFVVGQQVADSLVKDLGSKGNVAFLSGIVGQTTSKLNQAGAEDVFKKNSGLKYLGVIDGEWTDSIAKTETLKFLGTHPDEINGVWTSTPGDTGCLAAFLESGRPIPKMTPLGQLGLFAYWRDHPEWVSKGFLMSPPRSETVLAWDVLFRILQGQGVKIQSLLRPATEVAQEAAAKISTDVDETSSDWMEAPDLQCLPVETLNLFFNNGQDPMTWKPA